jgi:hypothetical protein
MDVRLSYEIQKDAGGIAEPSDFPDSGQIMFGYGGPWGYYLEDPMKDAVQSSESGARIYLKEVTRFPLIRHGRNIGRS